MFRRLGMVAASCASAVAARVVAAPFVALLVGSTLVVPVPLAAASAPAVAGASAVGATASPVGTSSTVARAALPPRTVVKRRVRLGHEPLMVDSASTRVRLTFRARRGQLVNLARWSWPSTCGERVLRHRGRTVRRWAPGYWKIRRSGTYTAVHRDCPSSQAVDETSIQVRKVVVRRARKDGAVRAGRDPDKTHLVWFGLRADDRLMLAASATPTEVVLPGRSRRLARPLRGPRVFFQPDTPPAWGLRESRPGRHFVALRHGSTATLSRSVSHASTLDTGSVTLASDPEVPREHLVTFDAPGATWVYPEVTAPDGSVPVAVRHGVRLLGLDHRALATPLMATCPGQPTTTPCYDLVEAAWLTGAGGLHHLSVVVPAGSPPVTVRPRAAVVAPPVGLDGPPVRMEATTPGQWVVAPLPEDLTWQFEASVSEVSPTLTDWRVSLVAGHPYVCGPDSTANGCGDFGHLSLTPQTPTAPPSSWIRTWGPMVALLAVPPGAEGGLSLSLRSR